MQDPGRSRWKDRNLRHTSVVTATEVRDGSSGQENHSQHVRVGLPFTGTPAGRPGRDGPVQPVRLGVGSARPLYRRGRAPAQLAAVELWLGIFSSYGGRQ